MYRSNEKYINIMENYIFRFASFDRLVKSSHVYLYTNLSIRSWIVWPFFTNVRYLTGLELDYKKHFLDPKTRFAKY